jgi:NAD(P)-dependent dehydrogenase (short-subunit alcohol dehydrogenase family)
MGELDGKVVAITGAGGGIGTAAAKLFAQEGGKVLLVDVSEEALRRTVNEIGGDSVSSFVADVTKPEDNQAFVQAAVQRYGGLDIFLGNAGIEGAVKPITEYPLDMFNRVISINLMGPFLGVRFAAPEIAKRGGGAIVLTSSVAGLTGSPGLSAYTMSKHGVIGLMRTAAVELAPLNIRVNTVNPAPVETRMMRAIEQQAAPDAPEQVKSSFEQAIPMKRYARPEEVARLMLFLASPKTTYITGGVYTVDGAMTAI